MLPFPIDELRVYESVTLSSAGFGNAFNAVIDGILEIPTGLISKRTTTFAESSGLFASKKVY
jgi:hypothetical protein